MSDLKDVCWVQLDYDDLNYLDHEYDLVSAANVANGRTHANADERIAAKVYLGASAAQGVSMANDDSRFGIAGAVITGAIIFLAIYGAVHLAYYLIEAL